MRMLLSTTLFLLAAAPAFADTFVYVSVAGEKRIAIYRLDADSGGLEHVGDTKTAGEPGALTTDPANRFLFASLRAEGNLAAFRIDPQTGKLTHLNTVAAGPDPAQIATDRTGRFLLCAYYVAAKVTVHAIGKDGTLSRAPVQSVPTADKAHAVGLDAKNEFAFVPHTGTNVIFQFRFEAKTGELRPTSVPQLRTPPNTGPRHLVFHPTLDLVYVDNEQGGSATVYTIDRKAGSLKPVQTLSTLPADFKGTNACAELRLRPDGKFLYVANRGHDSLARFAVEADGKLKSLGQTPTEATPRSFDVDPSGRFAYAAGESSGKIAAYRVDATTGDLQRFATYDAGRQPWWVMAVKLPAR